MGMIKTKKEIKLIKKSAKITNSCLPLIKSLLKKDKITEKEIAKAIRKKIYSQGARLSFQTIVACGKRSAKIHPKPRATNKIISGLGYVDFGACYKGYKTDVTVPFIKGKISKKERKIVRIVLKAYELAISSIKINELCWKLFQKVDNFLKKYGFELKHGLGHGLGLKIHEYPLITMPKKKLKGKKKLKWEKIKKIKFKENMVFTIEPAVYVKGLGGCRIENDILLTKKGIKILTNANILKVNK
jgi:Xaa-Pro aminopeptidase